MRAAILRVRQLHRPIAHYPKGIQVCALCSEIANLRPVRKPADLQHKAGVAHPCATWIALEGV
jgi:hypothetical protein